MFRIFGYVIAAAAGLAVLVALGVGVYVWNLTRSLPDHHALADYAPPVMTRVYASDGRLIAEYARQKRLYVPITAIPKPLVDAFLAAEDKDFYTHGGVDMKSIAGAVVANIRNLGEGRRFVGASTITQQVAKNFLLTNERTVDRKIKEAFLAMRLEETFSKPQILEFYLNEIYLGSGSYGVAAASLNYFDKSLDELTLSEMAFLASLPKAPNNYNPYRHYDRAIGRRNWVLGRMAEDGFVSQDEASAAQAEPIKPQAPKDVQMLRAAEYFVEEVRRELYDKYGEKGLYEGGLTVRTTIDTDMQVKARKALRDGLIDYDRRKGWRGPVTKIDTGDWMQTLTTLELPSDIDPWEMAVVLEVSANRAVVGLRPTQLPTGRFDATERTATVPFSTMRWARPSLSHQRVGAAPRSAQSVVSVGDVIYVSPVYSNGNAEGEPDHYALEQIPAVNGGLVAMDPHTGRVLAMVGGFSYDISEFNRATQAYRQPGSSFKPIVYTAALENGYTPTSIIDDLPIAIDQGGSQGIWRPKNYSGGYVGPSTLRQGIEKSRNLMTVRLARKIGMDKVSDYARKFHVDDNMQPVLAMSLGAGETTVLRMTTAFSILANGGKDVEPSLIDRVQDRWGRTIYTHDRRACEGCDAEWEGQEPPKVVDLSPQVVSPQSAYQMTSILEGVVQRGTAKLVQDVGVPVAGKTGTTNDYKDAWFVGYSPNLASGVYVGFDEPQRMGKGEAGGVLAAPIFRDFMKSTVGQELPMPFRIPGGLDLVRVDAKTGKLPNGKPDQEIILEAFKPGTSPYDVAATAPKSQNDEDRSEDKSRRSGGSVAVSDEGHAIRGGSGGLY